MFFAAPPRMGEKGPTSSEHTNPHVVSPYGNPATVSDETPAAVWLQSVADTLENSTHRAMRPAIKSIVQRKMMLRPAS